MTVLLKLLLCTFWIYTLKWLWWRPKVSDFQKSGVQLWSGPNGKSVWRKVPFLLVVSKFNKRHFADHQLLRTFDTVSITYLNLWIRIRQKLLQNSFCFLFVYFTLEKVGKDAGSIQDKCKLEKWKQFRGIRVTTYASHIYAGEAQTTLKTAEGACGRMRRWQYS